MLPTDPAWHPRAAVRSGATRAGCRVLLAITAAIVVLISHLGPAGAAWSPISAGSGQSAARSVGLPTATAATATSSSTVNVTWAGPGAASPTPTQYVVQRTAPTAATVCAVAGTTFACQDSGLGPVTTYTYTVEARIGAWSSGPTAGFQATTPAPPAFTVVPTSGTRTAGTAFNVVVTATTDGVTTDTSYVGAHAVTFTGPGTSPSGATPSYPATVTFSSGVGVASVTLVAAETSALTVGDGTRTGSATVTVGPAASATLAFSSSTPSCSSGSVTVGAAGSFTSKVTVYDGYGNPAPQTAPISITLSRSPNQGTLNPTSVSVPTNASEASNAFTYTRPPQAAASVTVTAARSGLTSATCSVQK
jgi:hypothetical protein